MIGRLENSAYNKCSYFCFHCGEVFSQMAVAKESPCSICGTPLTDYFFRVIMDKNGDLIEFHTISVSLPATIELLPGVYINVLMLGREPRGNPIEDPFEESVFYYLYNGTIYGINSEKIYSALKK